MRSPSGLPYHPHIQHVDPASTFWYLEAVPDLLEHISQRLGQIGEVLS